MPRISALQVVPLPIFPYLIKFITIINTNFNLKAILNKLASFPEK